MRRTTAQALLASALAALAVAGCGGSSKSSSKHSAAGSQAAAGGAQSATSATPSAAISSGPLRASLKAPNHAPIAGRDWAYAVHVTDARGRPLSGSVKIQFTFGGQVVGTDHPAVHPLRHGVWRDTLTFPKDAVGYPLIFEAVLRTSAGSATLGWPVTVRP